MGKRLDLLDYNNCIANLPNSVLAHFGVEPVGKPLPLADRYLEKGYRNIVVLLLDGMGVNVLEHDLKAKGWLRSHMVSGYHSVFPPTTVAATTAVQTGLQPIESGWLGWNQYYPQVDKNVTVFWNSEQETGRPLEGDSVAEKYYGYESVVSRLNEACIKAYTVSPYAGDKPDTFEKISDRIITLCNEEGAKYIYAYWPEPDHTMHEAGPYSREAKTVLADLETRVENLAAGLSDTLLIVTADHGHVGTKNVALTDYPDIMDCLVRLPSIESRALNFFIKKGQKGRFEKAFKKAFGKEFMLLSKKEVYETGLFGTGAPHSEVDGMIGDYVALARTSLSIFNTEMETGLFKGVHAGYTKDEMIIPFIAVECKQKADLTKKRCFWVNLKNPAYIAYHDCEWGVFPETEQKLYELFILETFQAGLSWECILNKRENFRAAYDGFDLDRVCAYTDEKVEALMQNPGLIRNRAKLQASIDNSRVYKAITKEFGSFKAYLDSFTGGKTTREPDVTVTTSPVSDALAADLKKRGMKFVGSTTIYAFLQAIGVIDAHQKDCFCSKK